MSDQVPDRRDQTWWVREQTPQLDWSLPIRNPNLAQVGVVVSAMAALFLVVNVASGFGLGWWGVGILLPFAVVGPLYFVAWSRTTLDLDRDGIRVTGIVQDRRIPWESIKRFDIYPPDRRHLMMLPRSDQAVARLADGSNMRLRAIQPWRPITVFGLPKYFSWTEADDAVAWLNRLCQARRQSRR